MKAAPGTVPEADPDAPGGKTHVPKPWRWPLAFVLPRYEAVGAWTYRAPATVLKR